MRQYLDLLATTLNTGEVTQNRTGVNTWMIPGAHLCFNLQHGFPAPTTKRLAWKSVKGELIGFLRGASSAQQFRNLDCKIWDANANDPGTRKHPNTWLSSPYRNGRDDLGKIYGVQWRNFDGFKLDNIHVEGTDQIENALQTILTNPTSRRILVSAWNPNQLDQMALPPCHILFQLLPNPTTKTMHLCMYQRSCDLFLGVPFNIASYSLLLHIFCHWTGYKPGFVNMFLADVHIYENHLEQVTEQLSRKPTAPPALHIHRDVPTYQDVPAHFQHKSATYLIDALDPNSFELLNYNPLPGIAAPMAV